MIDLVGQIAAQRGQMQFHCQIDQFRYIKIQPKTIDLSTRLWGINTEFVGFIPHSLLLRTIVLCCILIYRNWSIAPSMFSERQKQIELNSFHLVTFFVP